MMILDKEGIPRKLQKVRYHSGLRQFHLHWWDGKCSIAFIDRLPQQEYNSFIFARVRYEMNDYRCVWDFLESLYQERK